VPGQIISFKSSAIGERLAVTPEKSRKQQGIGLVELMIVIGIVAIIIGIAAPSFQGFQESRRLEGHAIALVTDIQYARSEAVARNRTIRIRFLTDADGTCYLIHTGNLNTACTCTSDGSAQCTDPGASIMKSVGLPASLGMRVKPKENTWSSMVFDPVRGTSSPAGSIDFIADSGKTIRQVVNIMGRTRTCSPEGSMNGYKVC
jgi:type IV fimbrial biogenesis protein FimT